MGPPIFHVGLQVEKAIQTSFTRSSIFSQFRFLSQTIPRYFTLGDIGNFCTFAEEEIQRPLLKGY